MVDIVTSVLPFAGSGLIGYLIGFMLKKVIRWIVIILGVLAGGVFMTIQALQHYGYIGTVNWTKLGNDISSTLQNYAEQIDFQHIQATLNHLGIPMTSGEMASGLGVGILAGFVRH